MCKTRAQVRKLIDERGAGRTAGFPEPKSLKKKEVSMIWKQVGVAALSAAMIATAGMAHAAVFFYGRV